MIPRTARPRSIVAKLRLYRQRVVKSYLVAVLVVLPAITFARKGATRNAYETKETAQSITEAENFIVVHRSTTSRTEPGKGAKRVYVRSRIRFSSFPPLKICSPTPTSVWRISHSGAAGYPARGCVTPLFARSNQFRFSLRLSLIFPLPFSTFLILLLLVTLV